MGGQPCKDCTHKLLESQSYGSFQLFTQSDQVYAVVQKQVEKSSNVNLQRNILSQLETRMKIQSPHIVKLERYQLKKEPEGIKVAMYYEYVGRCLRDRLDELKEKKKIFTQREIFSMIYAVQSALKQFHIRNIKHCCLNLDTILIKNNTYKLSDMSALTYMTSYNLVARGNRQQFLSQALLQKYQKGALYPQYEFSDDLFSLGMIALTIGSGFNHGDFYSFGSREHHCTMNYKAIDQALKFLERRYTQKLINKIKHLLCDKEQQSVEQYASINLNSKTFESEQQCSKLKTKSNTAINSTYISHNQSRIEM